MDVDADHARKLADAYDRRTSFEVLNDPNCPPETLTILARSELLDARLKVALHEGTPPEALRTLADDPNLAVQAAVACNANTDVHLLAAFADDEDAFVRAGVASNPACPLDVLTDLVQDQEERVVAAAAAQAHRLDANMRAVLALQGFALRRGAETNTPR